MPTIVESLVIALELDSKGVNTGLQQVSNKVQSEASKLDTALTEKARNMSKNFLAPFRAVVAPLIGAMSLGTAVSQYTAAADAVGKLSDAIGVNMEDLQAWGEAAARAGGTVTDFQSTIQAFNQRLQATALVGKDETSTTLQAMGVAALDASGKARNAFEVLRDMAEAAGGIDKAEFKGLAEKLGIDRGTIMLLQQGRTSLDDLIKRQKELGVYTKEDAEIAAKFNDATADMMQVIKAASAGLMRVLVPAITWLTDKLTVVVGFIRDNSPFIISTLAVITGILAAKFIPALYEMGKAGLRAMAPFAPFIAVAIALGLVIDDLWAYIEGGDSVLSDLWSQFGTGEEISQALSDAWNFLKTTAVTLFAILKPILKGIGQSITGLADILSGFTKWLRAVFNGDLQAAADAGAQVWRGFETIVSAVWEAVKNVVKNALKAIIGFILGDDAAAKFEEKWNAIGEFFDSLLGGVKKVFSETIAFIKSLFVSDTGANAFTSAWEGITKFFSDLWNGVVDIFLGGIKTIKGLWNDVLSFFGMAGDAAEVVVEEGKKAHEFYQGMDIDPEELAERAANGEDVSMYTYKRPTAADSVSTGGLNAAGGDVEQTVNNSTEVRMGNITINTQATDAAGISQGMRDQLTAKWGSLNMAAQSGVNAK